MSEIQSKEKSEISKPQEVDGEEVTKAEVRQVVAEVIESEFSGPIPPPNIIRGYEDVLPGSADRIIAMAERQALHRQEMEKQIISVESRDSLLGILFAFFLGLGSIVAAIIIVVLVPENSGAISGSILGITGIGSIVATFIKSTRSRYSHTENKGNNNENEKKK